jgi:hypothetical protein
VASYSKQEEKAWREANRLREELKGLRSQQKENGLAGNIQPLISETTRQLEAAENRAKAIQIMRANYEAGAKQILSPIKAVIDTSGAEQSITSLTKKLKDLQEQRKKAIAAGDTDLSKNLAKQINQVKADIKGLGGTVSTSTTHKATPQERAADKVAEAERTYAETLQKNSIRLEAGLDSTLDNKKKELSAQERLFDAYNDAYATYKDPAYKEASKQAAEKIKHLAEEVNSAQKDLDKLFPDMSKQNYNTGYAGSAQAKYDSARADLALGPMNFDAINNYIGSIKGMLSDANLGDELYTSMTEKLKDATTVSTLLQEMMERGLAGADLESTAQALKEKLLSPDGIDQTAIQSFLEELNKKIEEAGGVGLKLNADTGEVTDDKDKDKGNGLKESFGKFKEFASGLNQVASGLQQMGVQLPKGVSDVLGVVNGVISVIQGISSIISVFQVSAITANTIALGALTSAVTANTVSNFIPFFSGGGVVPAFAQGGTIPKFADGGLIGRAALGMTIPGNSMSGDNLRLPVDGGRGVIGVNSGEVILNRAQQGNLASQLEGGGMENINIDWVMRGEDMRAVINNNGRRTGRGEIVQSRRNRS